MFKKHKNERARNSSRPSSTAFRSGNAALSKSQRSKQSQSEINSVRIEALNKKTNHRRSRMKLYLMVSVLFVVLVSMRFSVNGVVMNDVARLKLTDQTKLNYSSFLAKSIEKHSLMHQSWSVDYDAVSTDALAHFGEVESASFTSRNPFTTKVSAKLTFRKPMYLWHDASAVKRYVDNEGVVFANNIMRSDDSSLIVIVDDTGQVLASGDTAVGKNTLDMIGSLPDGLSKIKLVGSKLRGLNKVVLPKSTREVRVYPKGTNYYIKFSTERGVDVQLTELKEVMSYLNKVNRRPVRYVDVRLEGKAFYR